MRWDDVRQDLLRAVEAAIGMAGDLTTPSLRLGVTGLSRAGKTVFITALVRALTKGGRLPLFDAMSEKRIVRAYLQPQPDDGVPRFDYEAHVDALVSERIWPTSTRRISQLRVTIEFESAGFLNRTLGGGKLHLDIIDYPGEWLVDLPLLSKDYATWSRETLARARQPGRASIAGRFLADLSQLAPIDGDDEVTARALAASFTRYLRAARDDRHALSALPPGRFLMPGDLEGSPALTFAPLDLGEDISRPRGFAAMMERRYEAYKDLVVRPFFRDHFARLDRQIVLVDLLQALNAGPSAMSDLEDAIAGIMRCFRPGRATWLDTILGRRIDRVLFAATKADHLHSSSHDRLEAILRRLVREAADKAEFGGADVDVVAMAAIRATREAMVRHRGESLPAILGVPVAGERMGGTPLDGSTEIAIFPGDLPEDPESVFRSLQPESPHEPLQALAPPEPDSSHEKPKAESSREARPHPDHIGGVDSDSELEASPLADLNFVRFRPPPLEPATDGRPQVLPHIRLDRAVQFLIGDRLT